MTKKPSHAHSASIEELTPLEARAEHARLHEEIAAHDRRYYQDDAPTISDAEYDALRLRYEALERAFPDLATAEVADEESRRAPERKIRQGEARRADALARQRLLATRTSANSSRACAAFSVCATGALRFTFEPKIDGLSCSLRYEKGRLVQAATRGDGYEGEDVTANIRTVKEIPQLLHGDHADVFEVRGEVYMTHNDFAALNARQKAAAKRSSPIRATPPPALCGSSMQRSQLQRPLHFFAYGWGETSALPANTQLGVLEAFAPLRAAGQSCDDALRGRRRDAGALPRDRDATRDARL